MFTFRQRNIRGKAPLAFVVGFCGTDERAVVIDVNQRVWRRRTVEGWRSVIADRTAGQVACDRTCIVINAIDGHQHRRGIDNEVNWLAFRTFITGFINWLRSEAVIAIRQRLVRRKAPVAVFTGDRAANRLAVVADNNGRTRLGHTAEGRLRVIRSVAAINRPLNVANVIRQLIVAAGIWRGGVNHNRIEAS